MLDRVLRTSSTITRLYNGPRRQRKATKRARTLVLKPSGGEEAVEPEPQSREPVPKRNFFDWHCFYNAPQCLAVDTETEEAYGIGTQSVYSGEEKWARITAVDTGGPCEPPRNIWREKADRGSLRQTVWRSRGRLSHQENGGLTAAGRA